MNERTTRAQCERALARLASSVGVELGTGQGQWSLDHRSFSRFPYVVVSSQGTGYPLGETGRTAREFVDACSFACHALYARDVATQRVS